MAARQRGMARAVEIVEHIKAIADREQARYQASGHEMVAQAFASQSSAYSVVIEALRSEMR